MIFKAFFFDFHNFGVRRSIDDVQDLENQLGYGALGLAEDVWQQKYEQRGFWNSPKYSFIRILKISLNLRYRVPDPNLAKNRIRNPAFYAPARV